jgi:predicted nucleic acid-binding protein
LNYFDTSCLVPLVAEEESSQQVGELLASLDRHSLFTSNWALVEFASMLSREIRMGAMTQQEAAQLQARFEDLIRSSFLLILPQAEDYSRAVTFLADAKSGLRGPDAMHLAVAANHGASRILSLDRKMISAGKALGLPISDDLAGYQS